MNYHLINFNVNPSLKPVDFHCINYLHCKRGALLSQPDQHPASSAAGPLFHVCAQNDIDIKGSRRKDLKTPSNVLKDFHRLTFAEILAGNCDLRHDFDFDFDLKPGR